MTLRTIHLLFVLVVMMSADLFGAWAVHEHYLRGNFVLLLLGIFSFLAGFGAIAYGIWFVRKLDRARIE
ncbi:MAG: hypothetical protein AABZ47_17920 [Planctomycetota bacterium]